MTIAVRNKQRIAALQHQALTADHAQQYRSPADKVELRFTGYEAEFDAKRAGGFDAAVVDAGKAHAAQKLAVEIEGVLSQNIIPGRIINNHRVCIIDRPNRTA